jgi:acyl carrier protein phosphodiesterase
MNFLSHHALARRVAPDAPPLFYAGNLVPDWLGISREGGVKKHHVEGKPGALADGVRLHLAADQRFHADPVFEALCDQAKALLRPLGLSRVFFFAHVAVELAMDAHLLRSDPAHAPDLFTQLEACLPEIAPETARVLERDALPELAGVAERFVANRWILAYETDAGLARRLLQLGQRLGIASADADSLAALPDAFAQLYRAVAPETEGLIVRAAPIGEPVLV